jgi:hypothetical protein
MPRVLGLTGWLLSIVSTAAILCAAHSPARSQATGFDAMIETLRTKMGAPTSQELAAPEGSATGGLSRLKVAFPTTVVPDPALLSRLQSLFDAYFDVKFDLTPILAKLVRESAVADVQGQGQILYNPANMLLLSLSEGWRDGADIRVAALEDLEKILKQSRPADPLLAAYGKGFEEFALLSGLMADENARETLQVIWKVSPRSPDDKERMRYLLLRPIDQARAIRKESPACQGSINQYIDDVRAGKRASIPSIRGLTGILKPTRFIRHDNEIILVLSDDLIARYYVVTQFDLSSGSCGVAWERPILAMQSVIRH